MEETPILPKHIGIIMDGNGRWAKKQGKMPLFGHRAGAKPIRACIEGAFEAGIKTLSLFAFSSENWNRPKSEVDGLMSLFKKTLIKELPRLQKHKIRLRILGDKTAFSQDLQQQMQEVEDATIDNQSLDLVLALNYGGQWEMVETARKLATLVKNGNLDLADINKDSFEKNMLMPDLEPVDLCIRTSGEQRISNFFLWQMAYAELYFTQTLWPDFNKAEFFLALDEFKNRKRNFGKRS